MTIKKYLKDIQDTERGLRDNRRRSEKQFARGYKGINIFGTTLDPTLSSWISPVWKVQLGNC